MSGAGRVGSAPVVDARPLALRALPGLVVVVLGLAMWFLPPPEGLTVAAWRLFAIFASAIFAVVINALPILTASVFAVAAAVLTGLLTPAKAYSGFANPTILLIVLAFLVARAVVKCGLGARIGHLTVSLFGRSTLGLAYSIFLVDGLIAPAFPSNTARSGVAVRSGAISQWSSGGISAIASSVGSDDATSQLPNPISTPKVRAISAPSGLAAIAVSQSADERLRLAMPENIRKLPTRRQLSSPGRAPAASASENASG